jgi:hypothetical protein
MNCKSSLKLKWHEKSNKADHKKKGGRKLSSVCRFCNDCDSISDAFEIWPNAINDVCSTELKDDKVLDREKSVAFMKKNRVYGVVQILPGESKRLKLCAMRQVFGRFQISTSPPLLETRARLTHSILKQNTLIN